MLYRVFYYKWVESGGEPFKKMEMKVVSDYKKIAEKYEIYYLTDQNGDVIIDNRKRGSEDE